MIEHLTATRDAIATIHVATGIAIDELLAHATRRVLAGYRPDTTLELPL